MEALGDVLLTALAWTSGIFTLAFTLLSIAAAYHFFRMRREPAPGELVPVTILKPLKGVDRDLAQCLRSFCRLDYPQFQLLFTLASPNDPALGVLSQLKAEFPKLDIEIVVSKSRIGFNPKINNLSNAAPYIKHPLILMSDSDVSVRPDFLRRMAVHLQNPAVGLVTCFYQSTNPVGLWARLEALSVNAHFLPQAVTAAAFGMRFAMGAAILMRRAVFEEVGGFALMADHLADDFILGEAVQASGYGLEIAGPVVESTPDAGNGIEHLRHQARWARTIRLCNPSGYLGSLALHGFALISLKLALFGFDAPAAFLLAALWAVKAVAALCIAHLTQGRRSLWSLLLLPVSEWISFGAWLSGFRSNQVLWRGEVYTLGSKGRMTPRRPAYTVRQPAVAEP